MKEKERKQGNEIFRVIGSVTNLVEEVLRLTSKAPKKFRFSICKKMDDLAIEIVANVYKANDSFISGYDQANVFRRRLGFELDALSKVKILGTIARVASRNQCISKGEYGVLARLLTDCQNLIGAWYKSDRLRLEKILLKDV